MTFVGRAVIFVGEGSLAVGRSFETAVMFIGRGGSAIGGKGKASRVYADRACAGKASADGDYADGAGVNRVFNG